MLKAFFQKGKIEAGCDEAGRGCLAGPVYAAAVILPEDYSNPILNDSKKVDPANRKNLRDDIIKYARAWAVASVDHSVIDEINILNASILAMHKALDQLTPEPNLLLIDGNRFKPWKKVNHHCIIKGDGLFNSIAAASILAKTFRDEFMEKLHSDFPQYTWNTNKGYATTGHIQAISKWGYCEYHRKSFKLKRQLSFNFED
ncbi:MAG: ribonuclease HII [Bacteroidales bacterium]|nr:ribonuclease HII [Bacteroidales bacterium]